MAWYKRYALLMIGLAILLVSAMVLAEANEKQARCESVTGKVVQLFDPDLEDECDMVKPMSFFAYIGIAVGIALMIINFVNKEGGWKAS